MKRAALEIAPFRGVLYDPGQAGGLHRVLAPPYDVISAAERESLAARSPHNVVRRSMPASTTAANGRAMCRPPAILSSV